MGLDPGIVERAVATALEEDLGREGDLTSNFALAADDRARARIVARQVAVLAGIDVAREVFRQIDRAVVFESAESDGAELAAGQTVATLHGPARAILAGERTALNFLMRMSGIATATARAVDEVRGTRARVMDTRKTAPGLRHLDKHAVACGGGVNHRMGLYDAVMIKDTHLDAGASIVDVVARALDAGLPADRITVEVRDPEQLRSAIAAGAGRALLDNMDEEGLRRAVRVADGRIVTEASGGLRPGRLAAVARAGVDFISLGWLTHSAPAADLALETEPDS